MKKILFVLLMAVLFMSNVSVGMVFAAALEEPNIEWAEEHGWTKRSDRYEKNVDGVNYQLWCGRNAYDKLTGADFTWQIMTVQSPEAAGAVTIPGTMDGFPVKSIGADTFRANGQIEKCTISQGIELIGTGAFENCSGLTEVKLPKGLKMIDAEAFYNCPELQHIEVPDTVDYVGKTSFCGETASGKGLETLQFLGNAPEILYADKEDGQGLAGIPQTIIQVYENTSGWEDSSWKTGNLEYLKQENIPTTPEVSVTPEVTQTPEITEEPKVTQTPEPTATPETTQTPEPTATPETTQTPEPTVTPEETVVPTITVTPEITEMPSHPQKVTEVFSDVYEDWYTEYLQYVFDNHMMMGIPGTGRFEPFGKMTKAQAVQVLYNMEGHPAHSKEGKVFRALKDVYEQEWYADAVEWAYEKGIITGDLNTGKFYPNAGITREELSLVLYRYAGFKGYEPEVKDSLENLKHTEQISNWAWDAVAWAVGTDLLQGIEAVEENQQVYELQPKKTTTRAQMATVMKRFVENVSAHEE